MNEKIKTRVEGDKRYTRHNSFRIVANDPESPSYVLQVIGMDGDWHKVAESPNEDAFIGMMNGLEGDISQLKKKV